MKLHLEPGLDFQLQAVDAVCDLFRAQGVCRTEFTVTRGLAESQGELAVALESPSVGRSITPPRPPVE